MEKESSNMFNDLNCNLLRPNWETSVSMDQNDPFESALSSMVSSPTASNTNNNGENIVLRELIGRLGTICNSTTSPFNSTNNSCYSTPLNSPPKLNLSSSFNHFLSLPTLAPFSSDPGFAERAARFSSFAAAAATATNNNHEIPPKQNNPIPESLPSTNNTVQENWGSAALQDSRENSTVSDQIFPLPNSRKRKSAPKGKSKETPPSKDAINAVSENSESSGKKSKSENEPPKDYIHVRARRGQATDAHSLAERVRREKISERMKVLQDLVPGCNKVTGKAVMLDEIINYVQSLQRQVEFLSMKLATVNPRMEYNMEAGLMSKDMMFPSRDSLPHYINPPDGYPVPTEAPNNPNITGSGRHQSIQVDSFVDGSSQVSSFWEDDLHSIVQMGIGQQNFQGILPANQMKVEL